MKRRMVYSKHETRQKAKKKHKCTTENVYIFVLIRFIPFPLYILFWYTKKKYFGFSQFLKAMLNQIYMNSWIHIMYIVSLRFYAISNCKQNVENGFCTHPNFQKLVKHFSMNFECDKHVKSFSICILHV